MRALGVSIIDECLQLGGMAIHLGFEDDLSDAGSFALFRKNNGHQIARRVSFDLNLPCAPPLAPKTTS